MGVNGAKIEGKGNGGGEQGIGKALTGRMTREMAVEWCELTPTMAPLQFCTVIDWSGVSMYADTAG